MSKSFTNLLTHIIFSTKERKPQIRTEIRNDLFAYVGGIIRALGGKALIINGMADHIHILAEAPPAISIAEMTRITKANSSKWLHQTFPAKEFNWQAGYGAFSVSRSSIPHVTRYIAEQEKHHRKLDFREEFVMFLNKHGVDYDPRYLWQ